MKQKGDNLFFILMLTNIGSKTLYPHQEAAVEWMLQREEDERYCGGLLCDEMGLGKTLSVLGLLVNSRVLRTLILAPLAVLDQWRIACQDAGFAICLLEKGTWKRVHGKPLQSHVYLSNYDKVIFQRDAFKSVSFQRLICDEAHCLRNITSKKTKRVRNLPIPKKWLLTGTPIVNGYKDLGSLMSILDNTHDKNHARNSISAMNIMNTYALARTTDQLKDILGDILPKSPVRIQHTVAFKTEEEAIFYRGVQGVLVANLQQLMQAEHMDMKAFLTLLLRLRQISVHPQVYIQSKKLSSGGMYNRPDWKKDSTKIETMVDILQNEEESHNYVIFCNFREEMELIHERLLKVVSVQSVFDYNGEMSAAARSDCIQKLEAAVNKNAAAKDIRHTVLLVQIHCGGTGLNLQFMDRVIFTTPWWTAALMDQAAGRVLRIGQKKQVVIHTISLKEEEQTSLNIDEFIQQRVDIKREICKSMIDAAEKSITVKEVYAMNAFKKEQELILADEQRGV